MEKIILKAEKRDVTKQTGPQARKAGLIPAIVYGHNIPTSHLAVKANEFERVFRKAGESTIIELLTADNEKHNVLIHDVQKHYLHNNPIHVDFFQVSMTEKLTATVPLEFVGEAPAVKALGGTLVKVLDEVEVECLPADLPHSLVVDISVLATFENDIHIKDIKLPTGVTVTAGGEELVVKVDEPRNVEEELKEPVEEDVASVMEATDEAKVADKAEGAEEAPTEEKK